MVDQQWYDPGLRPRVLINWQSFTNQGIAASWQGPFTDAVINAYTRWMNLAGVDLRPQFFGYTTNTTAATGELLIQMDPMFGGGSARLASTFGGYNALTIIFHRRNAVNGSPWNFVPYNANVGEFDMQAILMHELGHCLGLDHGSSAAETMFPSYIYHSNRFGPFEGDVARLKAVYNDFTQNRLRQVRSTDGAASWSVAANELTSYNNVWARTNQSPGVTGVARSGLYNLGWSHPGRIPTWLRTDGTKFLMRQWLFYGGERSVHGPAFASDDSGTLLWAWIHNDDNGMIRLVRSTNRGMSWHWVGVPAGARAHGTPGLAWTSVGGQSTWILVWSHFDRADQANTGYVRASVSTDDGTSWSAPILLNTFYKALSGVSVAADASNHVLVALAWAPTSATWLYGLNAIRTLRCEVAAGQLQQLGVMITSEHTRIQPGLTYDPANGQFILAWREQNFATTLATMRASPGAATWSGKVSLLSLGSHVAPAAGALTEYGEAVLWYAFEGP
jgi:Matrixin